MSKTNLAITMGPAVLVLLLMAISGCSWSPTRDNPVDPASPYYEPHRPPILDSVRIVTDCAADYIANRCSFEARAWITDRDNNLLYDSVTARLDTLELGQMFYNPELRSFVVRRNQSDLPQDDLWAFRFRPFSVMTVNRYGIRDTLTELFPEPQEHWPQPVHPYGLGSAPDTVHSFVVSVGWLPWPGQGHSYAISLYWNESVLVWDTSGISGEDTSAVIGDTLEPSWVVRNLYKWYLTVVDGFGNRMTALPQYFVSYPPSPPPVRQDNATAETKN